MLILTPDAPPAREFRRINMEALTHDSGIHVAASESSMRSAFFVSKLIVSIPEFSVYFEVNPDGSESTP
jgi:hypothetical protein